jgi:hypothetical protein
MASTSKLSFLQRIFDLAAPFLYQIPATIANAQIPTEAIKVKIAATKVK